MKIGEDVALHIASIERSESPTDGYLGRVPLMVAVHVVKMMVAVHVVKSAASLHGVYSVAVLGASGFAGAELLRLCASHPAFDVAIATGDSMAGRMVSDLYPSLAAAYPGVVFTAYGPGVASGCDLVFCALPHGASQAVVPRLRSTVGCIVDLAADFRLCDESLYPSWYGEEHTAPEMLPEFVFGLPELFRSRISGAELIAAPGCYVTAASLALPLWSLLAL